MAITAALSIRLDLKINNVVVPYQPTRVEYTLTEDDYHAGVWEIGTSEEDMDIGDVTTEGMLVMHSLEATGGNNVLYGPKSGGVLVTMNVLYPGRTHVMELNPAVVVRAKSSAGTVRVYYQILSK